MVLRNGQTVDLKVTRTDDTHVFYHYPPDVAVYSRPKSAIAYIIYSDGRRDVFDPNLRSSDVASPSRPTTGAATTQTPANRNRLEEDGVSWQDVKTTFEESDVRGMTRLSRISARSNVSYRDAIQLLKQKAAELGGTTVLVMDIPENDAIEVMGIAYRDQRAAPARSNVPAESPANVRRRTIAQQMDNYNNEADLEFEDYSRTNRAPARAGTQPARNVRPVNNEPDAVYLRNGNVIRGIIEENTDDYVTIRTGTGRVYEFSTIDIRRLTRGTSAPATARNTPSRGRYDDDRYGGGRNRYEDDYYDDYGVSGYKGIVDLGYNFSLGGTGEKGVFEVNTSHGYQVNEYFFAGAGLGLHIFNARDTAMRNPNKYPHYVGSLNSSGKIVPADSVTYRRGTDSSFMVLPIFLDVRAYLPIPNSSVSPFFMLRFGYAFNLSEGFGGMGIYMNPAIGAKFQLAPRLGLNFSLGYAYQSYGGIPKNGGYGYYYYKADKQKYEAKGAGGLSLKLGIEF